MSEETEKSEDSSSTEPIRKSDLILIRNFDSKDLHFIKSNWVRGLMFGGLPYGTLWHNYVDPSQHENFLDTQRHRIDRLLKNEDTAISVAALKDDKTTILGYSVTTPDKDTIHWVFVREPWRGIGLAKDLVTHSGLNPIAEELICTHLSKPGLAISISHEITFNPLYL